MKNLVTLLLTAALTSCGASFDRDWRAATQTPPPNAIEGPWQGTWHSVPTGHRGKLRCIVSPAKNKDGDHLFTYRATWARILSATFRAEHRVTTAPGRTPLISFKGQHPMPDWAGGLYQYSGSISPLGDFSASYQSTKDHGTFHMQRPK